MNEHEVSERLHYPTEEDIYNQWERVDIDVDTLTQEDLLCENTQSER